MRIYKKLVQLINVSNPQIVPFSLDELVFGTPASEVSTTWNTSVLCQSNSPSKFVNQVTVRYTRTDLSKLGSDISFVVPTNITSDVLITALNNEFKIALTADDILPIVIPTLASGGIGSVTLIANPISLGWIGTVDISLLSSDVAAPSTNEMLTAVLRSFQTLQSEVVDISNMQQSNLTLINFIKDRQDTNIGLLQQSIVDIQTIATRQQTGMNRIQDLAAEQGVTITQIQNIATVQEALLDVMSLKKADLVEIASIKKASRTNIGNSDMVLGQPCYALSDTNIDLASAAYDAKKDILGLVSDPLILSQTGTGHVQAFGMLTGTVAEWETATGAIGGLVPDKVYYLDSVLGKITLYPPAEAGMYVCIVGRALSTTDFLIRIEQPIKL